MTKNESTPAPDGPIPGQLPHSWVGVAAGLGVCLVALLAAGMLARQYVKSRPLNLRDRTTELAGVLERTLVNCRVPKENIARGEPEPCSDEEAFWTATSFDVALPDIMDGAALVGLVARRMQPFDVALVETAFADSVREMRASLGNRVFATLRIREKKPKTDLTSACEHVLQGVNAWLADQNIPAEFVETVPSERKEDDKTIWQYARLNAPYPSGLSFDKVETGLREAVSGAPETEGHSANVAAHIGTGGTTTFSVALDDYVCADIVFSRTGVEPPSDEFPASALAPLQAGLVNGEWMNGVSDIEEVPLDSTGLDEMELGRKLAGISTPSDQIPRIAIILDDGGYGGPVTARILALDPNLTLAILPGTPFGARTAKRASELGFEVMLHMPMEGANMPGSLLTGMTEAEMRGRLDEALAGIPEAVGVNNHMGSVFTSNANAINRFMNILAGRGLYFIDSRTTPRSVAFDGALKHGIPAGSRDVFLDHQKEPNYIIGQFNHLMEVAKERGYAIGIGHFRPTTVQVLVSMLPQLEKNGIKLVHASELVLRPAVAKPLEGPVAIPGESAGNTEPIPVKSGKKRPKS
ncbi:MAG TPA: divergent polysaccharide deacetylase family protein [Candidatus Hydrogenedentes bacterium]|nr:divergent polysaccharide deacetylase family protein [Candidatus Hydrogenedentota bacterium]HRT19988.1 divergent polysaccharide deacetylase family protein [Candidatus Hydrogenedentota bacterium]HRT64666.1 divergent polysaccharide deacetylase family protein [Candidatus Hydrogenedentota bacterium]